MNALQWPIITVVCILLTLYVMVGNPPRWVIWLGILGFTIATFFVIGHVKPVGT